MPYDAVAVIPARGGSERLPGKNLMNFCGKPLLLWSIDQALELGLMAVVITDDDEIAIEAENAGAFLVREPRSDGNQSPVTMLQNATAYFGNEWVVLLQPTSPLRHLMDIKRALETSRLHGVTSVVSVVGNRPLDRGGATFKTNGAIYMVRHDILFRGQLYGDEPRLIIMPWERSIDIDTIHQFKAAEALCKLALAEN